MTDNQHRTLERFQTLLETNASAHILRAARESGIWDALRGGQKTVEQLVEACGLRSRPTQLLLDCLVALEVVERYEDDFALAPVAQLLTDQDQDLRDDDWGRLAPALQARTPWPEPTGDPRWRLATSQWVHTAAAMQVASVLEVGVRNHGWRVLDLGCGAGVWSASMAYRDPKIHVTAVDSMGILPLAQQTAESIQILDRWEGVAADPFDVQLTEGAFDAAVVGGWLHTAGEEEVLAIAEKVALALRPGGALIVPDLYREEGNPGLTRAVEALRVHITTPLGRLRRPVEMQRMLNQMGFDDCQFAPLSASNQGIGLFVARRKTGDEN